MIKKNILSLLIFCLGILLIIIGSVLNSEYVKPGSLRLLTYIGWLTILIGILIFSLKNKKILLTNLLFISLIVLGIELFCFFSLGMPNSMNKKFTLPDLPNDHIAKNMGTVPYADSTYHNVLVKNNDTVYDVHYTIDKYCKRKVPNKDSSKNKFALFFGCSIAFGEGVQDDQTVASQFQELSETYNAYNYAYSAYGTNHMLARLQYQDLSKEVHEKDGVGVYVFFWDHIYRAIGTMDRYTNWAHNEPYYTIDNKSLVRKKMFKDGRPFISYIYEAIYQTNIIKKFKIDFPASLNDSHFDLITEMILESKKTYTKQFNNENFIVLFYPSYVQHKAEEMKKFKSYLGNKNISFLDINKDIKYETHLTLGGDPHPNPTTHKMVAKRLWEHIKKDKN